LIGGAGTAFVMMRLLGHSLGTALLIAAGLGQIGEFSFILADLGIGLEVLPLRARDLVLGTSILTILANPILFIGLEKLRSWLEEHEAAGAVAAVSPEPAEEELRPTTLHDHAVLVGFGRVGGLVGERLRQAGWPLLVIEDAAEAVERLHRLGIEMIQGNAAEDRVLAAANLVQARVLLIAIPNAFEAGQIVKQARAANPGLEIVARAHFDAEVDHLMQFGANTVIMGEREIALAMLAHAQQLPGSAASAG
jgi:monovalent cation:H+ antiporter-2, CPA2 family